MSLRKGCKAEGHVTSQEVLVGVCQTMTTTGTRRHSAEILVTQQCQTTSIILRDFTGNAKLLVRISEWMISLIGFDGKFILFSCVPLFFYRFGDMCNENINVFPCDTFVQTDNNVSLSFMCIDYVSTKDWSCSSSLFCLLCLRLSNKICCSII